MRQTESTDNFTQDAVTATQMIYAAVAAEKQARRETRSTINPVPMFQTGRTTANRVVMDELEKIEAMPETEHTIASIEPEKDISQAVVPSLYPTVIIKDPPTMDQMITPSVRFLIL